MSIQDRDQRPAKESVSATVRERADRIIRRALTAARIGRAPVGSFAADVVDVWTEVRTAEGRPVDPGYAARL